MYLSLKRFVSVLCKLYEFAWFKRFLHEQRSFKAQRAIVLEQGYIHILIDSLPKEGGML